MSKDLIKVDHKEFGLEETKAQEIANQFKPMLDTMVELEKEANEVFKLDINDPESSKKARELRLKYVKVRTGTDKIHKAQKAFYLAGGKFVDGWKNAQRFACNDIEGKLESIEKHQENLAIQKIENRQKERELLLSKFEVEVIPDNLGVMADEVWNNYLAGTESNYKAKKEAEKKAEEERIAKEKAEKEERERIAKENERLKAEALEREKKEKIEAEKRAKIETERKVKEEAERKDREEKERKEREAYEAKIKAEREEKERIEKEEKAKREKAEEELKAKIDAENKAKEEEEKRIQLELNKGDSAKVKDLLSDLDSLKTKYSFRSKKNEKMYSDVGLLIDKVINHISK